MTKVISTQCLGSVVGQLSASHAHDGLTRQLKNKALAELLLTEPEAQAMVKAFLKSFYRHSPLSDDETKRFAFSMWIAGYQESRHNPAESWGFQTWSARK